MAAIGQKRTSRMETTEREATFAAIEAEFRTQPFGYLFTKAAELARFDLYATYVGGDDALTVRRCNQYLADLYGAGETLQPFSSEQAAAEQSQAALRSFFRRLYS